MENLVFDIVAIISALAAVLRSIRKSPVETAYEDALAKAILSDVLEQAAEPLTQPKLVETFRALAREATAEDKANEKLSNLSAERIWFLSAQVKVRGSQRHVTLHDGGAVEVAQ